MVVALPVFRDGTTATAADLNALVANITNLYGQTMGGYTTKRPTVTVRVTSTTRALAANTDTAVTWDVADINNDAMWSSSAPTAINITTAGTYRIEVSAGTEAGVYNDGFQAYLCVNGTTASTQGVAAFRDGRSMRGRCGATLSLAANAKVYAVVNSGVARNLASTAGGGCRLSAVYLGGL